MNSKWHRRLTNTTHILFEREILFISVKEHIIGVHIYRELKSEITIICQ